MAKVEIGQWIQPRGRRPVMPIVNDSLRIVVDSQAVYSRYLTEEEVQRDFNFLLSIDPSLLVFIIGPMTGRRNPNTLRVSDTDIAHVDSTSGFFKEHGLIPYHCQGRQNYGEWGVSSEQASMLDGTALDHASLIVCLPGASASANTIREIKRTILTGKSLIMFFESPEEKDFMHRVVQLILSAPISYPPSAVVPVNGSADLSAPLGKLLLEAPLQREIIPQ